MIDVAVVHVIVVYCCLCGCGSDQPAAGRLHPRLESDESGSVRSEGGDPGEGEQALLRVCGEGLVLQRRRCGALQHQLQ